MFFLLGFCNQKNIQGTFKSPTTRCLRHCLEFLRCFLWISISSVWFLSTVALAMSRWWLWLAFCPSWNRGPSCFFRPKLNFGERTENGKKRWKVRRTLVPRFDLGSPCCWRIQDELMSHEEKDKFSTVSLQLPSVNLQGKFLLGKWLPKICFACEFERCSRLWVTALRAWFSQACVLMASWQPFGWHRWSSSYCRNFLDES